MDYLQQLLNNQPVEWKKLGEVAQYSKTRIDASLLNENNYVGVDNMLQNCKGKTFSEHVPTTGRFTAYAPKNILIGNIRPYLKKIWFADNEGGTNGDVLVIQTTDERVLPEYLYQVLSDDAFFSYDMQHAKGAKMPRGNKDKILDYIIPIPPLSVQSRIVEILDKFTSLEAELELRKKQYQHYREQLLNFSYPPPSEFNVVYRKLGEMCDVLRGRRLTKKQLSQDKEGFAVYHGGIVPIGYYPTANRKANSTMVINVGASAGTVGYSREDFWSSDGCFCFTENSILLQRFLFYYLQSIEHKIKSKVRVAGIPTLDANILYNLEIPIPPLSEQERIVEILDKFDTLTNSISEGLPLEIQLRRQQYEYYREQLLDFRN